MSHISTYKAKIKDIDAFIQTLSDAGYAWRQGDLTVKQFGRNWIKCHTAFKLPGWQYEIAINNEGELLYDHFGSKPSVVVNGKSVRTMDILGKTIQDYNEQSIVSHAWMECDNVTTEDLEGGDKRVVLEWL